MDMFVSAIKYTFVVAFAVEAILIVRAIVALAREKAQVAAVVATPEE